MSEEQPENEQERQEYTFTSTLGSYLLSKEKEGATEINLSDLDLDTMRVFFKAGWGWGKGERMERCPTCGDSTLIAGGDR